MHEELPNSKQCNKHALTFSRENDNIYGGVKLLNYMFIFTCYTC